MKKYLPLVLILSVINCTDYTVTSSPANTISVDRSNETIAVRYCMGTSFPDSYSKVEGLLVNPMCQTKKDLEYALAYSSFSLGVNTTAYKVETILGKVAWVTGAKFAGYNLGDFSQGRLLLQKIDSSIENAESNFLKQRSNQHLNNVECSSSSALIFMFDSGSLCGGAGIGTGAKEWYESNFVRACKVNLNVAICSAKASSLWEAAISSGVLDPQKLLF